MQLERFKNQKFPTQGKETPPSLDLNPTQPWPFWPWHIQKCLKVV